MQQVVKWGYGNRCLFVAFSPCLTVHASCCAYLVPSSHEFEIPVHPLYTHRAGQDTDCRETWCGTGSHLEALICNPSSSHHPRPRVSPPQGSQVQGYFRCGVAHHRIPRMCCEGAFVLLRLVLVDVDMITLYYMPASVSQHAPVRLSLSLSLS